MAKANDEPKGPAGKDQPAGTPGGPPKPAAQPAPETPKVGSPNTGTLPGTLPGTTPATTPAGADQQRYDPMQASGAEPPVRDPRHSGEQAATPGGATQAGPLAGQSGSVSRGSSQMTRTDADFGPSDLRPDGNIGLRAMAAQRQPGVLVQAREPGRDDVTVRDVAGHFREVIDRFRSRDFWGAMRGAADLLRVTADAAEQASQDYAPRAMSQPGGPDPAADFDRVSQEWDRVRGEVVAAAPAMAGNNMGWYQAGGDASGAPQPLAASPPARSININPNNILTLVQLISDARDLIRRILGR